MASFYESLASDLDQTKLFALPDRRRVIFRYLQQFSGRPRWPSGRMQVFRLLLRFAPHRNQSMIGRAFATSDTHHSAL